MQWWLGKKAGISLYEKKSLKNSKENTITLWYHFSRQHNIFLPWSLHSVAALPVTKEKWGNGMVRDSVRLGVLWLCLSCLGTCEAQKAQPPAEVFFGDEGSQHSSLAVHCYLKEMSSYHSISCQQATNSCLVWLNFGEDSLFETFLLPNRLEMAN